MLTCWSLSAVTRHGDIVIATIDGAFTCKSLQLHPCPLLLPANRPFAPILVDNEDMETVIFGVVRYAIHTLWPLLTPVKQCLPWLTSTAFMRSCETVFRPDLRGKPMVVLSNNDGYVVARSQETKSLDIKMGAPCFKVRAEAEKKHCIAFLSNYAYYADMSHRVMTLLAQLTPRVEVNSIENSSPLAARTKTLLESDLIKPS